MTRYSLWAGIAIAMVLLALLTRGTWGVYSKMQEAAVLKANALQEREALLERQGELTGTIAALETPRGVEEEIRTRYSVVMPGETEYVLMDQVTATTAGSAPSEGFWDSLKSWFGL